MRALARGESGTLIACTPRCASSSAPANSREQSKPLGGTISTMVTNSPSAMRRPNCERSRSGLGSMAFSLSWSTAPIVALDVVLVAAPGSLAGESSWLCFWLWTRASSSLKVWASIARSALRMERMCTGVVPQQPPTQLAPARTNFRAKLAMYSGELR